MSNRPAKVTKAEIKRTVEAVREAGIDVGRVEVDHDNGKVNLWRTGVLASEAENPCDELLQ